MPQEVKPPTVCPKCKSKVVEFKGVYRDTGKPYHFWGCVNPDCKWIWKQPSKAELRHEEVMKGLRYIFAELRDIKKILLQGNERVIEEEETLTSKGKEEKEKVFKTSTFK